MGSVMIYYDRYKNLNVNRMGFTGFYGVWGYDEFLMKQVLFDELERIRMIDMMYLMST